MNKEIGGYFELEDISEEGYDYYPNSIKLNSARNCFIYIILLKNIKKVYVPSFLCESVKNACIKYEILYEEYDIDGKFNPVFNQKLKSNEYLLLVNYYGHLSNKDILYYKNFYKNIIVDNTHSFFQRPVKGIDTFYSCRKYFGVPDGGVLYTSVKRRLNIDTDYSDNRVEHLIGRKQHSASDYYDKYRYNEKLIASLDILKMSSFTENIINHIVYDEIISKRNDNFDYLEKRLKIFNTLSIKRQNGPFCYPLKISNGSEIRKKLISSSIYIPILWPNMINTKYWQMCSDILPIPCDQRYGIKEMERICIIIIEVLNGTF